MEHEINEFCKFWFRDGLNKFGVKEFHKYQKNFLLQCVKNKRVCALWSRQSGKSLMISLYSLYMCLVNTSFRVLMVAPTQEQSAELYSKLRKIALGSELIKSEIISSSQTEINFRNGSRVKALPCGPEGVTIRGLTADIIIIEEAGYVKDSIVNEVIMPMIGSAQSYGQCIKIGTPKGKNHFYESSYGKETKYSLIHIPYTIPLDEGQYSKDFINEQKNNLTELEFKTEYEAEFIEDADAYFKQDLIDSCVEDYVLGAYHPKSIFTLGVDFARMGEDESVFTVVEESMEKDIRVNFIDSTLHKPMTDAIGRIKVLDEKYTFQKIYLDETGMGAGPTDMLTEELGERVEGLTFTVKSKQDLYSNLKKLMEQGRIKIPNNRKLLYQLADLRYEVMSSGDLKIHHSERGHDDFADSLALSCWYFKEMDMGEYEPFIF